MTVRIRVLLVLMGAAFTAQGQVKNDTLKSVTIWAQREPESNDAVQVVSSEILNRYAQQGLQQVLEQHSNVFIKNYGVSNMSTISIRGSSAAQTAVLWQGININNATTGLSDFSLLPVSLFNQVEVAYGSRPNNPGIGGALVLENKRPDWFRPKAQYQIGSGWESLQNGSISLGITRSFANFYNQFRVVHTRGENRFGFYNPYLPGRDTLEHSRLRSTHILNNFFFTVGRHELAWHTWWQNTQREIPPAAFEQQSDATESIQSFRNVLSYQIKAPFQTTYRTKIGFIYDAYRYSYPLITDSRPTQSWQVPADISIEKKADDHRFFGQATWTLQGLLVPRQEQLSRAGINGSYHYAPQKGPWEIHAKLHYEFGNWFKVKPAASLFVDYSLSERLAFLKGWSVYGSAYTAYRLPTLNELFYQPGGNIDLKPEQSRNTEAGLQYKNNKPRWKVNTAWSTYYRWVDNWIVWFGSSIFTPQNVLQVNSRGLEGRIEAQWYTRKLPQKTQDDIYIDEVQIVSKSTASKPTERIPLLTLDAHYAYTLSTTEASDIPNNYSIGKQLPYVPRYQVKINPGVQYRRWGLHYQFQYTGYRFTTTDESNWLNPFTVSSMHLRHRLQIGKTKPQQLEGQLGCMNIFNQQYESMVGRVMPGRYFNVQLQWRWP